MRRREELIAAVFWLVMLAAAFQREFCWGRDLPGQGHFS